MTTTYPGTLDSYTTKVDGVDYYDAADINDVQDAIEAIETELGTNPAGTASDLVTRLAFSLSNAGPLQFAAATTLTISSGSVTPTQNRHLIDTESAAASDYLDTITATAAGWVLFLSTVNSSRDVTIRHGIDNILCANGQDITLGTNTDLAIAIYDGTQSAWLVSGVTGAGMLNGTNTWTGVQTFGAAIKVAYSSLNTNATLDSTYQVIAVDATTAAVTVTLPAAASATGIKYDVKKVDASANYVILDGNLAETIDGAATYGITSQYTSITLVSNGSGWYII